jgi:hypothetical protein
MIEGCHLGGETLVGRTMTTWLRWIALGVSLAMAGVSGEAVGAERPSWDLHIRSKEPTLLWLVDRGQSRSETFRALVNRLTASDLVIYLDYDFYAPRGLGGQVSFISHVGGRRYLRVRIDCRPALFDQIALIAHELQHAVEIADATDVVDERSMAKLYRRIGIASDVEGLEHGIDSAAAVETGHRVTAELLAAEEVLRTSPVRVNVESPGKGR